MSEPFGLKAGDTTPTYSVVLTGGDGLPIDLTGLTVQFTMQSLTAPYPIVIDHVEATVDPDQVGNKGRVTYTWVTGDTDVVADYVASWYVVQADTTYPSDGYNYVSITPAIVAGAVPQIPVATLASVEVALGRALTTAEASRATVLIDQAVDILELWLNRDLSARVRTEKSPVDHAGRLCPNHGPVQSVTAVTVAGTEATAPGDEWEDARYPPGEYAEITYVSGDVVPRRAASGAVSQCVAATILAGPAAASGAVMSYSVEGTSITYGPSVTGQGASSGTPSRIVVGDLTTLRRLRRPVVLW
jgi:hypothetical protein